MYIIQPLVRMFEVARQVFAGLGLILGLIVKASAQGPAGQSSSLQLTLI